MEAILFVILKKINTAHAHGKVLVKHLSWYQMVIAANSHFCYLPPMNQIITKEGKIILSGIIKEKHEGKP